MRHADIQPDKRFIWRAGDVVGYPMAEGVIRKSVVHARFIRKGSRIPGYSIAPLWKDGKAMRRRNVAEYSLCIVWNTP